MPPPPPAPPTGPGRWRPGGRGAEPERSWHYRRSLASRVTLLATIAVGLSVAFVAGGAFFTARDQLSRQLDTNLMDRARIAAKADLFQGADTTTITPPWAVGASDVRIAIVDDTGASASLSFEAPPLGEPEVAVAAGVRPESVRTVLVDGVGYRMVAVPVEGRSGAAVVIAQSLEQQEELLRRLGGGSLGFGLLGVLAAGISGWGVARNGLRPVRRLTKEVERIAETEELRRMPVEGDDELARLATAFNRMVIALDASRTRQRELVTDAGHELRTPLTSLRTNVDLLVQSEQDAQAIPAEMRTELLEDIRGQIEELTQLIGDLTELARDEPLAPVVGEVDLAEVVEMAVARVRRRAPGADIDVRLEPWRVVGEASALERCVINLLDNAAKWGPDDGTITVRLSGGVLTVDDQGPGIAPEDREHVFDRFWRARESRTMPGSGLGLSIVRQVAERHSGTAHAEAAPGGGARLVLSLPGRSGDA
ncbi:MAG: two-component sensor histidine kinase [Nocardioides sp.]|nr:two-component sensor histidine kinase [Nocardioides sp.]